MAEKAASCRPGRSSRSGSLLIGNASEQALLAGELRPDHGLNDAPGHGGRRSPIAARQGDYGTPSSESRPPACRQQIGRAGADAHAVKGSVVHAVASTDGFVNCEKAESDSEPHIARIVGEAVRRARRLDQCVTSGSKAALAQRLIRFRRRFRA